MSARQASAPSAPAAAQALHAPAGARRFWANLSPRWLITGLITLILVVGEAVYGVLGGYERLATALGCAMLTELVLSRLVRGRFANVQSAYISGVSMSLLTKPQAALLWPFALGGSLAIASKYVLTWRGRHLWNPTNLAIALLLLIAPGSVTILSHEWGNDLRVNAVIWSVGLLIASRAKILHVTLTYLPSFLALSWVRSLVLGIDWHIEVAPVTGPMYQLFIFFMITDPATTVSSFRGRMLVAFLIAVLECAIRLGNDYGLAIATPFATAPAIFALAILGPIAKFIDQERLHRKALRSART